MPDPTDSDNPESELNLSRRDFGKAVGLGALVGPAVSRAKAEELRDQPFESIENLGDVPAVDGTFAPSEYVVVGPFQWMARESDVDSIVAAGGMDEFSTGDVRPGRGKGDKSFESAIAGGASLEFETVRTGGGSLNLDLTDKIDPTGGQLIPLTGGDGLTDSIQDWYGLYNALYQQAFAVTTLSVNEPVRAVLESSGTVYLNGRRYEEPSAVVLQRGINFIAAKQTITFGSGTLNLEFRPPRAPVEVSGNSSFRGTPQNHVIPDLREGRGSDFSEPASFRVTNTTGESVSEATLSLEGPEGFPIADKEVTIDPPLAPFESRRINTEIEATDTISVSGDVGSTVAPDQTEVLPVETTSTLGKRLFQARQNGEIDIDDTPLEDATRAKIGTESPSLGPTAQSVALTVSVSVAGETDANENVPIRIRGENEKKRQATFRSEADESVQSFSFSRPANFDTSSGPFELLVTLHGANVPSINQAGAYTQRDDVFVLAPNARGPVNYDHTDLGRVDDMEALDKFTDNIADFVGKAVSLDETNTYLTGHSMGGHGTWHVGLLNSDRFAAIAPSAGWDRFDTYLGILWSRDTLSTHPRLNAVDRSSRYKNFNPAKTENAVDGTLPTFVLQGGQDPTVLSVHPRTLVREMSDRGLQVEGQVGQRHDMANPDEIDVGYLEVPGAGHWWDQGITDGNDGVNHPDMMSFLRDTTNEPYPDSLHFFTTNLQAEHSKYWVGVELQRRPHDPTRVSAESKSDGLHLSTENVVNLIIDLEVLSANNSGAKLMIDGETLSLPTSSPSGHQARAPSMSEPVIVNLEGSPSIAGDLHGMKKTPDSYGPLRQVHYSPYRLVYGTAGSSRETDLNRNLANVRSNRLIEPFGARAPAVVVPDTAVDQSMMDEYNLVLFGTPTTNSVLDDLAGDLPIGIDDRAGAVMVDGERYEGEYAVEYIYPNPEAPDNFVQIASGTSTEAAHLTSLTNWTPTFVGNADYQVYDKSWMHERWNGAVAAGFFDRNWELNDETGYISRQNVV
jgi:pimeloyl-ACP methyl ester carboxylesterase